MIKRTLLGMLTPSSNTVLEPITSNILSALYPQVTAHFSRFRVTEISMRQEALAQFDATPIVEAARLLADARMSTIGWSGTASSWLGFDTDQALCQRIEQETGVAAATSVLALNEILALRNVGKLGLVTPYVDEIQERIIANYQAIGVDCIAERHFGDHGNFSFSEYDEDYIETHIRAVAKSRPEAITVLCTNLRGAPLVHRLEQELGIPIYDSVSVVVWKSLRLAGIETNRIQGWGSLFTDSMD